MDHSKGGQDVEAVIILLAAKQQAGHGTIQFLKIPVQGVMVMDWVNIEGRGFSRLPLVQLLKVADFLPGQKSTLSSSGPALTSNAIGFQSSLMEKGHKAVAMSWKALHVSSLLQLEKEMSTSPKPAME